MSDWARDIEVAVTISLTLGLITLAVGLSYVFIGWVGKKCGL